ncbi:MAG: small basic protein [Planctomycetes bacterium]|nr:small basic protein [Planctomycetota bacterium]
MSIHKSLSLGSGLSQERSVFTRRERIERLMERGELDESGSVYGLPKVRTQFKVLSKKQMKALAAVEREKEAEAAAIAAAEASKEEEAI